MERLLSITGTPEDRDALVAAITAGGGASGADVNLSNVTATAIPTALSPSIDQVFSLGSATKSWAKAFIFSFRDSNDTPAIVIDATTRRLNNTGGAIVLDFAGTDLSVNTRKITNASNPSNPQDVATKNYVDGKVVGATGSFTSQDGKTVTVANGLITSIV